MDEVIDKQAILHIYSGVQYETLAEYFRAATALSLQWVDSLMFEAKS